MSRSSKCAERRDADKARILELVQRRGGRWWGSQMSLAKAAAKTDRFLELIKELRAEGKLHAGTDHPRFVQLVEPEEHGEEDDQEEGDENSAGDYT